MRKNGFFAMIHRAKYIKRWGLMRNSERENLSEHSFDTAIIAHALCEIGNKRFGKALDSEKIATAALFHDAHEIMTGDLPTPVKYKDEKLLQAYRAIENAAGERLLSSLPDYLLKSYEELVGFETQNPEMYRYIKAADKISAYIKCIEETKAGNPEFAIAKSQQEKAIRALGLPEAEVFLDEFMDSYGCSLDELQSE